MSESIESAACAASPVSHAPAADIADPDVTQNDPKRPIGANHLNDDVDRLSPKQRLALDLLAAGNSLSQVGAETGVSRKTLYRWRHEDADFAAALRARRRELWGDVADQIRALLPRAVGVLARQLDDRYDRARFDAARAILRLVDVKSAVAIDDDDDDNDGDDENEAA